MSEEYNNMQGYDNMQGQGGTPDGGSYGMPPKKPKKKRKALKVTAVVLCVIVMLGLVGGGSYAAFSRAKNYLDARAESKAQEETAANANAGNAAGLTVSENNSGVETTKTGSVVLMDVSDVVSEVKPSVVAVTNEILYTMNFAGQQASQSEPSSGSGVIVSENDSELLIVTNNHVVDASSSNGMYSTTSAGITVQFIDGETAEATVKGTDESSDLAILAVKLEDISEETRNQIKIATVGSSDELKEGEGVIAIGNALGYGLSITVGYVSALNREVTVNGYTNQYIQTDAAINPGNSGGGLFNTKGELIGINDAKTVDESVEGIGYAIPISSVGDVITDLMNQVPRVQLSDEEKGYLGISGQNLSSSSSMVQTLNLPTGIWVTYVQEGSAADKAGIQVQDIITSINGKQMDDYEKLREEIGYYAAGEQIELTLERWSNGGYEEFDVTVTLGSYAEEAPEGGTLPQEE